MRVVLEVVKGTHTGKRFEFVRHDTFMVGRSKKVHFRIPDDPYFGRYHFMIEVDPPKCFLRDLGSVNGTRVNGQKVRQVHLAHGDIIQGGKTSIRVHVQDATPAAAPEEGKPTAPRSSRDLARKTAPVSMDTTWSTQGPGPSGSAELHCTLCGKLAEDTLLGDLSDTRFVTYVCKRCRDQKRDARHPIPNFELLEELGKGALGPVYKARRASTGRLVVLKTIPPEMAGNQRALRLFLREMQLGARLDHPNIVPVIEIGDAGGDLWLASEFVPGPNAAQLSQRLGGTVPLGDAVDIICQTLDALEYAHSLNLVHRDVKPPNIIVTGNPGGYTARLADFGLMKTMDEAGMTGITREGEVRGTVPFMPPEQVLDCRFVKPAGDIYQAGATLYWLLTGNYIYDFDALDRRGERKDPFWVILEDPIVPLRDRNASVPETVADVIETALEREPEDRFEAAVEMGAALRKALGLH